MKPILLYLSLLCLWQGVTSEEAILVSPNVTDFGVWGKFEVCPRGEFVTAFQLKVEPKHSIDDTALNGIRFFCGKPPSSNEFEWTNITSKVGHFGNWGYVFNCSTFAVGFQMQSQPYQGQNKDDTAADNLKIRCADGQIIEGFNDNGHIFANSTYTAWQDCPAEQAFCGLQTQVERYQAFGDDTALNNIKVKCCDLKPAAPVYPVIGVDEEY